MTKPPGFGSGVRAAFQGEAGAFSQTAARQVFGPNVVAIPLPAFDDVFAAVTSGRVEFAVVPIENSLAGSIHQNYDLLARHRLEVVGETYVRIEHNLIVLPGTSLGAVRRIYSHPVALAQCQTFLRRFRRIEKIPFYDTAGSVKHIRENGLKDAAAIASADAAALYGMRVLRRRIEDDPENFTRFLALTRRSDRKAGGSKTSIVFALKNAPGALFKALSVFALRDINLSKIESRPIRGKPWEYLFYVDLSTDSRSPECAHALRHLREMALYFKILGSYNTF
jgi:prephenate dehydratase